MRRSSIVLLVGLALLPVIVAGKEQKQKKTDPTPLAPVQSTPAQRIVPPENELIASATTVDITGSDSSQKVTLKVGVFVHAKRPAEVIGSTNEIWLNLEYVPVVEGQKPEFPLSDYIIDTTRVQVIDGEQVPLERVSLTTLVNQTLDSASANKRTFVPSAPPPPPVGSSSTYYIDCFGGYYTNTVSCRATPDNSSANDAYAAQQAGYLMGTAIKAWRVKHHNQTIARQAREALVFYQTTYLRDRLTFLGNDLVETKPKVQGGVVIFRRTDRVRPNGPFTVHVPISEPGTGMERVLTFQFVD
jgi:hypothetical protein